MFNDIDFVPKILVVGDPERLRARVHRAGRAVEIIGVASFHGELEGETFDIIKTQTFLLDGKLVAADMLKTMVSNAAFDYIVFTDYIDAIAYTSSISRVNQLVPNDQVLAIDSFVEHVNDRFHAFANDTMLYKILLNQKIATLLDADGYFADGSLYVKPFTSRHVKIDGICSRPIQPIFSNIYDRLYQSSADCSLRHYDAILLTAERDIESLLPKIYEFSNMAEHFVVFVRAGTPLRKYAAEDRWPQDFVSINYQNVVNGAWFVLHRKEPSDAGLYVVTHKTYEVEGLPSEYKSIHAGRALADDLGYLGDDTGKSISVLNPYLNEMTAAYWIWKNTAHDYVGIAHYRRFFSSTSSREFDPKNILTGAQAIHLLKRYDMIVSLEDNYIYNQYGFLLHDTGKLVTSTALTLAKTMMSIYQPSYVDVFDYVMSSCSLYRCNMMITRKHVFDAYCEWLFSFLLPAHEEFMTMVPIEKLSVNQKRIFGYISERLMNIWLLKNELRLKELPIMENIDKPRSGEDSSEQTVETPIVDDPEPPTK